MGEATKIEWTDYTFNPWWGCVKVSPACEHCYAETWAKRTGHAVWGVNAPRRFFGKDHWAAPLKWNREAGRLRERKRVFCASMADWLEDREDLVGARLELLRLIHLTPNLDWQLLSKRPENFKKLVGECLAMIPRTGITLEESYFRTFISLMLEGWRSSIYTAPSVGRENYWIGTTVENQLMAEKRLPLLLEIPAKVRFLSCEPLLGPIDLRAMPLEPKYALFRYWPLDGRHITEGMNEAARGPLAQTIHWLICGGESGPGARFLRPAWARSLRDQCAEAGVPFFFKQWGEFLPDSQNPDMTGISPDSTGGIKVGKAKAGSLLDAVSHRAFPDKF